MDVLVVGGTGMLGRAIVSRLTENGHDVWISSRSGDRPKGIAKSVGVLQWDTRSVPTWDQHADALVQVGGESIIGQFWSRKVKDELWRSRVEVNEHLTAWIKAQRDPPEVFVTGSAVGFYGPDPAGPVDEDAAPGDDFLARLCKAWEDSAFAAEDARTRVVAARCGIMLDADDGALAMMRPIWRLGLGGKVGNGRQPFPWVTKDDAARAIVRLVEAPDLRGPFNVVAPERVTNATFTKALGKAMHRPAPWIVPPLALRMLYGEGADLLSAGQEVVPRRLKEAGFEWQDPTLDAALQRLLA